MSLRQQSNRVEGSLDGDGADPTWKRIASPDPAMRCGQRVPPGWGVGAVWTRAALLTGRRGELAELTSC